MLLALGTRARRDASTLALAGFSIGAVLISGLTRPILGADGARVARDLSVMTWGGLITCACLAILLLRDRAETDAGDGGRS